MLATEKPGGPFGTGIDKALKSAGLDGIEGLLPQRQLQDITELEPGTAE